MKGKSRLILLVSIWEILFIWAMERILDFLVKRLAVRFKGEVHLGDYLNYLLWRDFVGRIYLSVYFRYFWSYKSVENYKVARNLRYFPKTVRMILKIHKDMHRNIRETKECRYCKILRENKSFFQIYAPNPKLYPPFKFSKRI